MPSKLDSKTQSFGEWLKVLRMLRWRKSFKKVLLQTAITSLLLFPKNKLEKKLNKLKERYSKIRELLRQTCQKLKNCHSKILKKIKFKHNRQTSARKKPHCRFNRALLTNQTLSLQAVPKINKIQKIRKIQAKKIARYS